MKVRRTPNIQRPQGIRRRALRIMQHPEHPLYLFTLRAKELLDFAEISRLSRNDAGELLGYQRPEVRKHIQNIVDYLKSNHGQVLFPGTIILALSSEVRFTQTRGPKVDDGLADAGTLDIPAHRDGQPRPAWIVDGQQRALALSRCGNPDFPIAVSAFIADDVDTQREQFLRINSTKPLPRSLITELLPKVFSVLPSTLAAKRAPSALCEMLNADPESPFYRLIRRASTGKKERKSAVIVDTTITVMLQDSFSNPTGCLFTYRNLTTGETDFKSVRKLLFMYWHAVRSTFPAAWGLPPSQSRLMHGAGLRAMGKLMDRVMGTIDVNNPRAAANVRKELDRLSPVCAWTSGTWEGLGGVRWNEIQNVPTHVRTLSNFLIRAYTNNIHQHQHADL